MSKYSVEKNDLQKEVFIFGDDVDGVTNYTGSYIFTPKPFTHQKYNTTNKILNKDMECEEIPYSETSNEHGGTTVSIGYIT